MAAKAPGKLNINPALFNVGAMKPGAKNPKLEAKRRNRDRVPLSSVTTTTEH